MSLSKLLVIPDTSVSYQIYPNTILPAKSDSDVMFCLQSYQGFIKLMFT